MSLISGKLAHVFECYKLQLFNTLGTVASRSPIQIFQTRSYRPAARLVGDNIMVCYFAKKIDVLYNDILKTGFSNQKNQNLVCILYKVLSDS